MLTDCWMTALLTTLDLFYGSQAIGYAEAMACLAGEYTQAEAVERTLFEHDS